ncbi:MAG TPA: thiamine phosphate synthase [Pyrinomonadaceae bacterium]|nr:thiamine phosphate synthase [Pyrinomonadaceae bacterium]
MIFPKIYPITDVRLAKLSHAEQVEKLIAGGAEFIQLREKYDSPKEFFAEAQKALEIARKNGAKIIINDRVDIALALKADGVHLGQDDLPPEAARRILGKNAIIGFSTHSVTQAIEAVKMPIDYVAIGPIFATKTKENPDEVVGLEGLKKVRDAIGDFPLVAIGGIELSNFTEVLQNGADSCAIISGLISDSEQISERTQQFISLSANS